jgi:membrane-associated protease RseP (regulator of RpoE activity)
MVIARKYVGMGVAALVMSLGVVPAQGQSAPSDTKPEIKVRKHVVHTEREDDNQSADQQSINIVNDSDAVSIQIEDGKVTSATRNGKKIPLSQINKDGGLVQILGKDGQVEFEMSLDEGGARASSGKSGKVQGWTTNAPGKQNQFVYSLGTPKGGTWDSYVQPAVPEAEPPKVMIGVQLAEPDRSLLGHFHLKAGEATLVSAVHEGLPAAEAGLKPYDLIVAVEGGKKGAGEDFVRRALRDKKEGQVVTLTVIHEGQKHDVKVKLIPYDHNLLEKSKVESIPMDTGLSGAFGGDKQWFLAPDTDLDKLKDHLRSLHLNSLSTEDQNRVQKELDQARLLMEKSMTDAREQVEKAKAASEKAGAQQPRFRLFRGGEDAGRPDSEGGTQDRVKGIEDRLDRLEKMLERMIEKQDSQGRARRGGGDKGPDSGGGGN